MEEWGRNFFLLTAKKYFLDHTGEAAFVLLFYFISNLMIIVIIYFYFFILCLGLGFPQGIHFILFFL